MQDITAFIKKYLGVCCKKIGSSKKSANIKEITFVKLMQNLVEKGIILILWSVYLIPRVFTPLKTSENHNFSDAFRVIQKSTVNIWLGFIQKFLKGVLIKHQLMNTTNPFVRKPRKSPRLASTCLRQGNDETNSSKQRSSFTRTFLCGLPDSQFKQVSHFIFFIYLFLKTKRRILQLKGHNSTFSFDTKQK